MVEIQIWQIVRLAILVQMGGFLAANWSFLQYSQTLKLGMRLDPQTKSYQTNLFLSSSYDNTKEH